MSHVSSFRPALLFSICNVIQPDVAAEQNHTSVLPSVLSKLRDWRLLDPHYRCSSAGVRKLAVDLVGITDEAFAPTSPGVIHALRRRLRMKWVGSDSPSESRDRESSPSTPPPPSPTRSGGFDLALQRVHALTGPNERRFDAGYESNLVDRLDAPDSEDASALVSPQRHVASGFRSGCAACCHPRFSGPLSTPLSPYRAPVPFSRLNTISTQFILSPQRPKPGTPRSSAKKLKREKHKSLQSGSRGAHVDENEVPVPKPVGQTVGVSFPRQRTDSPRISNALLSREPSLPFSASAQQRQKPNRPSNSARQGDKHTFSHRLASVDLRLSMRKHPSPSDLHLHVPTRTKSFPFTAANVHWFGSIGAGVPKPTSHIGASRSSKRLPSWSQTHPTMTTTTSSPVKSTTPLSSLAVKACLANPPSLPFGARSRPSSTPIPSNPSSRNMERRDPCLPASQRHKHSASLGALPVSPSLRTRKRQAP